MTNSTTTSTPAATQAIRCSGCGKVIAARRGCVYTSRCKGRIITFVTGTIQCEKCGTIYDSALRGLSKAAL